MTVGEIIDEAIEATIDKLTEGTMDANVIRGVSFALEKALPALWDAEVLEFGVRREEWEPDALWWFELDGDGWCGSEALVAFGGPVAERIGQRVRVMVAPTEEGK